MNSLPPIDKMYVPPIWFFGWCPASWCYVHPPNQHHQRKDLRFPLVLVLLPCHCLSFGIDLAPVHHPCSQVPRHGHPISLPFGQSRRARGNRPQDQSGRLVRLWFALKESWPAQLSRRRPRFLPKARRQRRWHLIIICKKLSKFQLIFLASSSFWHKDDIFSRPAWCNEMPKINQSTNRIKLRNNNKITPLLPFHLIIIFYHDFYRWWQLLLAFLTMRPHLIYTSHTYIYHVYYY